MPTPILGFLLFLMLCSGAILLINLKGSGRALYDYWNLDNEDDTPPSRLDVFRSQTVFYGACVVLVGSIAACLWLLHAA